MGISTAGLGGVVFLLILCMEASLLEEILLGLRDVGWDGEEEGLARGDILDTGITLLRCVCSRNLCLTRSSEVYIR